MLQKILSRKWKLGKLNGKEVYIRVSIVKNAKCQFIYSEDGNQFRNAGNSFTSVPSRLIGAKVGIYATRLEKINDCSYPDYDWFRITPLITEIMESSKKEADIIFLTNAEISE